MYMFYVLHHIREQSTNLTILVSVQLVLKMIAGLLPEDKGKVVGGSVQVNGVDSKDDSIVWSNVVSYVDQIDRLHGYLTVQETLKFAFDCRFGGTHRGPFMPTGDDVDKLVKELDEQGWLVDLILRSVGLKRVADTFVGNEKVRGVSGGEKVRFVFRDVLARSGLLVHSSDVCNYEKVKAF
jgi:ABC-type multidrug transport system ATPase subunit